MSTSEESLSTVDAEEDVPLADLVILQTIFQKSVCLDWERAAPNCSRLICSCCLLRRWTSYLNHFFTFFFIWNNTPVDGHLDSDHILCQNAADCLRERACMFHRARCRCFLTIGRQVHKPSRRQSRICERTESRNWKWALQLGSQQLIRSSGMAGRWVSGKPQKTSASCEVTLLQSTLSVKHEQTLGDDEILGSTESVDWRVSSNTKGKWSERLSAPSKQDIPCIWDK